MTRQPEYDLIGGLVLLGIAILATWFGISPWPVLVIAWCSGAFMIFALHEWRDRVLEESRRREEEERQ